MHHGTIANACYSTTMANGSVLMLMLIEYMERYRAGCVMLILDEQRVRWYSCMFEFECIIAWYTMHHDTNAFAHSPTIQQQ